MIEPHSHGPRKTAVVSVQLSDPGGTIRGQVQIDTGPMRLADLVPTAYELTMVLAGRANRREEQAGRSISCRAGCGACCRQLVPLSPPEAFFLADVIATFEDGPRNRLMERFDDIVDELKRRDMMAEMLDPTVSPSDPALKTGLRYFALQKACPFLVDESCAIHSVRPVACREYNVTSPTEWCTAPYAHDIAKVPMPLPLSLPLVRMSAELFGSKPQLVPLPLVPHWVKEHEELGQRHWPGLELFRCFMHHLGAVSPASNRPS